MSHVAKIDVKLTNIEAVRRACNRIGANFCGKGFQTFYDGTEVGGYVVHLPSWEYNIVIKPDGSISYDNYNGEWGDIQELGALRQAYAIECGKVEAEEKGYTYEEEELPTGLLKLTINI